MTSRFEEARAEEFRTTRLAEQTEALKHWLEDKHPEIPFSTAVLNAFKEDMGNAFFVASGEDFEFSLRTMHTKISPQRVPSEAENKSDLIDEISVLLRSPNSDGRGGRYSEDNLKLERAKMSYSSVSELTQRRDEIVEKQRLQKLSAGQIRQELAASRPQPQAKVLPQEFTRERIHQMPSIEIKKLIRDWGANVVNNRLAGRN